MMCDNRPIGIFDSGVGGLSVLKELRQVLPNEKFLYFGDTLRVPYGDKSIDELVICTRRILDFFKTQNVKAVIVACNTCSANTIDIVKNDYDFEILGLIEPTAEYVKNLDIKKIGLIATIATVNSSSYNKAIEPFGIKVFAQGCPKLVKLVESGQVNSPEVKEILADYLKPLLNEKIEKLILGCTHYPFLVPAMKEMGFKDDFFVNPAICLAQKTKEFLEKNRLSNKDMAQVFEFFVSAKPEEFKNNAKLFFGNIQNVTLVE